MTSKIAYVVAHQSNGQNTSYGTSKFVDTNKIPLTKSDFVNFVSYNDVNLFWH